ncbi:MAG: ABC transporter permease subunit [Chloroflexi bacterium]|nr:ABC transporter permease subunit [Chloroflexota bacterium]
MLRNIFLKTIRDYRLQILILGGWVALLMLFIVQAYTSLFSGPDRIKLMADYKKGIQGLSFFIGKGYDTDTLGGFITIEVMGIVPVVLAIFALMVGSAIIRGEEEKGSLDLLLSMPHSRTSVLLQKWAGMVIVLCSIGLISWLGLIGGAISSNLTLDAELAAVAHLNMVLLALIFGSLALLFGQLVESRKTAAGWTGGILAATFLMNSLADTINSLQWLGYFTPFHYYSLSKPLVPSIGTDWGAMAIQAAILIPLVLAAVVLYVRRDHSGAFNLSKNGKAVLTKGYYEVTEPNSLWLANNFGFGLKTALPGLLIWGLGISAYILIIMSSFNNLRDSMIPLLGSDLYKQLGFQALATNENILSALLLLFMMLLCAAYAVVQVASWTVEENEGRLELILSTPESRWRLLTIRFSVTMLSSALMIGITAVTYALSSGLFDVAVDTGKSVEAFFGLWIVCVIVEAIGFGLAAFGPGWAVAICSGLVVLSYIVQVLASALNLPEWMINLSVFHQYGTPLVNGLAWTPQFIMLTLSAILVIVAGFRFWQRDIAK